jgi:hypothetical protein
MSAETLKDIYNSIEPFIWYALAILLIPALRRYAPLRDRLAISVVVCVFGTSDFYESETWWSPWWLLAWKAGCLATLAILALRIRRQHQMDKPHSGQRPKSIEDRRS